jgi:hypothetical protein
MNVAGNIGTSISIERYVCASLNVRAKNASVICSAAAKSESGTQAASIPSISGIPSWNFTPRSCSGTRAIASRYPIRDTSTANRVASEMASHFPATTAKRLTGFTSKGSSDPRSRSPAVASMAR